MCYCLNGLDIYFVFDKLCIEEFSNKIMGPQLFCEGKIDGPKGSVYIYILPDKNLFKIFSNSLYIPMIWN